MLYQYLWKHRMMGADLRTTDGRTIKILRPGIHNSDSGPDFTDARLRIDGQEWCGNVEVHVKASDWYRHGHDSDPAYSNVILHVVAVSDTVIPAPDGKNIPQTAVSFPEPLIHLYSRLANRIREYPCEKMLHNVTDLQKNDWMASLSVERLQQKAKRIMEINRAFSGDWEWTCFVSLARALGFGLNSEPLEMLARVTPLNILAKHSDNDFQLEALLFGQAGMLDTSIHIFDEYYQGLCREYFFLARKYGLRPMRSEQWKFSKTRPQNFPSRRIAILAKSVSGGFSLLSKIIERRKSPDDLRELFNWILGDYWTSHFDFDVPGVRLSETLSEANITLLLINLAAPIIYAYGLSRGDYEMAEYGPDLQTALKPENNKYVRHWGSAGITCRNAADSQAVVQLCREYCELNRCLECRFGHILLRKAKESGFVLT